MKKSKFISLIMILLNFFMLASCINSEEDLKREKIYKEIYSLEREQECMIITYNGLFSKDIEFMYGNEIEKKLAEDDIKPFDILKYNFSHYYNNNVFLYTMSTKTGMIDLLYVR